jgi:hypothetical protein
MGIHPDVVWSFDPCQRLQFRNERRVQRIVHGSGMVSPADDLVAWLQHAAVKFACNDGWFAKMGAESKRIEEVCLYEGARVPYAHTLLHKQVLVLRGHATEAHDEGLLLKAIEAHPNVRFHLMHGPWSANVLAKANVTAFEQDHRVDSEHMLCHVDAVVDVRRFDASACNLYPVLRAQHFGHQVLTFTQGIGHVFAVSGDELWLTALDALLAGGLAHDKSRRANTAGFDVHVLLETYFDLGQ